MRLVALLCCYELSVALSSGRRYSFPWQLDGGYGYVCGLVWDVAPRRR